jgi:hypothetical protein
VTEADFPIAPSVPIPDDPDYLIAAAVKGTTKGIETAAKAYLSIIVGRSLGLSVGASLMQLRIVDGRPIFEYPSLLSFVRQSGIYDYKVTRFDDEGAEIEWYRISDSKDGKRYDIARILGKSSWTVEESVRAGLWDKKGPDGKNTHQRYPKTMCLARAVGQGFRAFVPDVVFGIPIYASDATTGLDEISEARSVEARVVRTDGGSVAVANRPTGDHPTGNGGAITLGDHETVVTQRRTEVVGGEVVSTQRRSDAIENKATTDASPVQSGPVSAPSPPSNASGAVCVGNPSGAPTQPATKPEAGGAGADGNRPGQDQPAPGAPAAPPAPSSPDPTNGSGCTLFAPPVLTWPAGLVDRLMSVPDGAPVAADDANALDDFLVASFERLAKGEGAKLATLAWAGAGVAPGEAGIPSSGQCQKVMEALENAFKSHAAKFPPETAAPTEAKAKKGRKKKEATAS